MTGAGFTSRARTDARDWLIEADEPLAGLQRRAGGDLPGLIVSPALLGLVRKARSLGLRLARPILAHDGGQMITAWVEVAPKSQADGGGCSIAVANWHARPSGADDGDLSANRRAAIVRQVSELNARLDPAQKVLAAESRAPELDHIASAMRSGAGRMWTEFCQLDGALPPEGLPWHLLNGVGVHIAGSQRTWRAHLIPLGAPDPGASGFELHLVADQPMAEPAPAAEPQPAAPSSAAIGREIAPVLRQPIARIIANAETIRTQLAGPVADEYSHYAADIATAGEHLLALLEDLIALEAVEDEQFSPAPDRIDLADVARRAAGLLAVRSRERSIVIDAPPPGLDVPAIGEFRRVLQITLNLLGNAVRYSPEGSHVSLQVTQAENGERARLVVADQGPGLSDAQQARVFDKFERLGRQGDGGTGLGLYISRRLARAMHGELSVESVPGQGARFTLDLPADQDA